MVWKADRIKNLRLRLGWSQAELSRRLGVKVSSIQSWEADQGQPSMECMNSMESLESHLESYSACISGAPVAEAVLSENNLNQILRKDLHQFTGQS